MRTKLLIPLKVESTVISPQGNCLRTASLAFCSLSYIWYSARSDRWGMSLGENAGKHLFTLSFLLCHSAGNSSGHLKGTCATNQVRRSKEFFMVNCAVTVKYENMSVHSSSWCPKLEPFGWTFSLAALPIPPTLTPDSAVPLPQNFSELCLVLLLRNPV